MLIDSHSHIDTEAFDADRAATIARARAAGVHAQIVPAIARHGWAHLRQVCQRMPACIRPMACIRWRSINTSRSTCSIWPRSSRMNSRSRLANAD
jgi:Tat protein secretion system quality control protein TatD with DNase activity